MEDSNCLKNPPEFLYISNTIPTCPPCSNVLIAAAKEPAMRVTIAAHELLLPTNADPAAAIPVSKGPAMAKALFIFNAMFPSLS
ncbi:hypothetical protein PIB30_115535 [Stylosanthes scabra]|uniref:Uncharacterized protein n=1 Tax=Stylosanthes scabra TaxID=79078 RepID=A0ABU6V2D2_9FABA|nr:hypothetical protein [Stylosanthes scabra]